MGGNVSLWIMSIMFLIMSGFAMVYRQQRDELAGHVLTAYNWVDEIIDALKDPDEEAGNAALDALIKKREND